MMVRPRILLASLLAAFCGWVSVVPAWAMYQINPTRLEVTIPKGKQFGSAFVRVSNPEKETLRLKAYLADWELSPDGGMIFHEDKPMPDSINSNVRFNPREFEVQPGKTQIVRIAIKAPEGQDGKEYHSMLFFEDLKTSTQRMNLGKEGFNASIEIKQRLGVPMYVYNGDVKSSPQLVSFTCSTDKNQLNTQFQIENTGSHHFRGLGSLFITQWDAATSQYKPFKEIPIMDQQDIVVLPNSKRSLQQVITKTDNPDFPAGKYMVEIHLAAKTEQGIEPIVSSQEVQWIGGTAPSTPAVPTTEEKSQ